MLFKEINQKFTEKVAEYIIVKGYSINAGTMSGSQGEIAHVDFTDGKDVYRVLLEKTYVARADSGLFGADMIRLVVGKSTDKSLPNTVRDTTVWNNHLDIIEEEDFYEIGSRRDGEKFYGTMEEAQAAAEKRHARYESRRTSNGRTQDVTSDKTVDIVLPFVKKHLGGKRISRNQIKVSKKTSRYGKFYQVDYFSNSWVLG